MTTTIIKQLVNERLDRAAARKDFERFLTLGREFYESLGDRMAEEKAK